MKKPRFTSGEGVLRMMIKNRNAQYRLLIKNIFLIVILLFCGFLISFIAYASTYDLKPIKNRPTGWGGLAWEDPPDKLPTNRILISDDITNGKTYIIPGETAVFGDANASVIKYYFKEEKLIMVDFLCESTQVERLFKYAVTQFGPPPFQGAEEDKFAWADEDVGVYFQFKKNNAKFGLMRYLLYEYSTNDTFGAFPLKTIPNKNKLNGFGGIKLGDPLEVLREENELSLIRTIPHYGIETYTKKREVKKWNDFEIKMILYNFLESKLVTVDIRFVEETESEQLLKLVTCTPGKIYRGRVREH
jgi:hypothetical protein